MTPKDLAGALQLTGPVPAVKLIPTEEKPKLCAVATLGHFIWQRGNLEPNDQSVPAGWTASWCCPREGCVPGWVRLSGAGGLHGTQTVVFYFSLKEDT